MRQAFLILCNNATGPVIAFYKFIAAATQDWTIPGILADRTMR
jgi:hypothetical protein